VRRFLVVGPGSNAGKTTMGKALVLALREQPWSSMASAPSAPASPSARVGAAHPRRASELDAGFLDAARTLLA